MKRSFFVRGWMRAVASVLVLLLGGIEAQAAFPDKPVFITVPFSAGGGTDILARILAEQMSEHWHQPVVVNMRPGGSAQIGEGFVARSQPDGYNLLFTSNPHTLNPGLFKSLPYDTVKDFAPISLLATTPLLLVVNPSLHINSVKELIALAKAKPDSINYASSGVGGTTNVAMEMFKYRTKTDMVHVPYQGASPIMKSLLGGETQVAFVGATTVISFIQSGSLKALAVSNDHRVKAFPDYPTIAEAADVPGFNAVSWFGLLAPGGTPKDIVDTIQQEVVRDLKSDAMQKALAATGADTVGSSPEDFAKFIDQEIRTYGEVIKAAGIKLDQ